MKQIKEYRNQIDQLDNEIVELLALRVRIAKKVQQIKKESGLPSLDTKRFEEILTREKVHAEKLGLNKDLVEKVLKEIHSFVVTGS